MNDSSKRSFPTTMFSEKLFLHYSSKPVLLRIYRQKVQSGKEGSANFSLAQIYISSIHLSLTVKLALKTTERAELRTEIVREDDYIRFNFGFEQNDLNNLVLWFSNMNS